MPDADGPVIDARPLTRVGLAVHPTRQIDAALDAIRAWAGGDTELVQLPFAEESRRVAPEGEAAACDLVVAIGGDGTTLAAIRLAAAVGRPVLGVACGSLGALTTVAADEVGEALARFRAGEWCARPVPALALATDDGRELVAYNDAAVVRQGAGQIRMSSYLDGTLYTRLAGDGAVISTPAGSSAYSVAAGGPLLAGDLAAFVLTHLPVHGGYSPPLVIGAGSQLDLEINTGHAGGRLELDGRPSGPPPAGLSVRYRPAAATLIAFPGQESHLTGLRRRGILVDSPRIIADDQRG
jgi:NAD+ kinase